MAEHREPTHDGRFGDHFDAEIGVGGLVQIAVWLAATCLVAFAIIWVILRDDLSRADAGPTVAAPEESTLPPEPRLQADPEGEYRQMRRELDRRLGGYGWVDEPAGVAHIPIDRAVDRLLEQGVDGRAVEMPAAAPPPAEVTDR